MDPEEKQRKQKQNQQKLEAVIEIGIDYPPIHIQLNKDIQINQASHTQDHHHVKMQNSPYNFYQVNNKPHNSLVILKKIEHVLPLLVIKPVFILLDCSEETRKRVVNENIEFIEVNNLNGAQQYIKQKLRGQLMEILSPLKLAKPIGQKFGQLSEIKKYHFYIDKEDQQKSHYGLMKKFIPNGSPIIQKLGEITLQTTIIRWSKKKNEIKVVKSPLPNVIYLNENGWKANIQLRTMIAMLNQVKTDKQSIMNEFYKLDSQVYNSKLKKFKEYNTIGQIIEVYTKQSPENKITNNLFRASNNPSELYYCQPYFQALFKAIKKLYMDTIQQFSELTCYRGGTADDEEIAKFNKNKGEIIQNLGFLSTTTDRKIGEEFANNLMFIISVKKQQRDSQLDYGFADISKYSSFPDQKEFLFNPLNTFTIEKVQKVFMKLNNQVQDDRQINVVYLTYGSLAELRYRKNNKQQLSQSEEQYAAQAQYLIEDVISRVKNQGDAFISANEYLEGGLQYWIKQLQHYQSNNQMKAQILHKIGMAYRFKGQYKDAIKNFDQALKTLKSELGYPHPNIGFKLSNIGETYLEMGKYLQAIEKFEQCLDIQEKTLEAGHPNIATTYNNLGSVYLEMEQFDEALKNFTKSLQSYKKTLGNYHLNVAKALSNIGSIQMKQKNYQKALQNFQNCHQIQKKVLGDHHPNIAITLSNLGWCYMKKGKLEKALKIFEESLSIQIKTFGDNHQNIGTTFSNFGFIYYEMQQYEEALKKFEQCLKIKLQSFDVDDPAIRTTLNNIKLTKSKIKISIKTIDFNYNSLQGQVVRKVFFIFLKQKQQSNVSQTQQLETFFDSQADSRVTFHEVVWFLTTSQKLGDIEKRAIEQLGLQINLRNCFLSNQYIQSFMESPELNRYNSKQRLQQILLQSPLSSIFPNTYSQDSIIIKIIPTFQITVRIIISLVKENGENCTYQKSNTYPLDTFVIEVLQEHLNANMIQQWPQIMNKQKLNIFYGDAFQKKIKILQICNYARYKYKLRGVIDKSQIPDQILKIIFSDDYDLQIHRLVFSTEEPLVLYITFDDDYCMHFGQNVGHSQFPIHEIWYQKYLRNLNRHESVTLAYLQQSRFIQQKKLLQESKIDLKQITIALSQQDSSIITKFQEPQANNSVMILDNTKRMKYHHLFKSIKIIAHSNQRIQDILEQYQIQFDRRAQTIVCRNRLILTIQDVQKKFRLLQKNKFSKEEYSLQSIGIQPQSVIQDLSQNRLPYESLYFQICPKYVKVKISYFSDQFQLEQRCVFNGNVNIYQYIDDLILTYADLEEVCLENGFFLIKEIESTNMMGQIMKFEGQEKKMVHRISYLLEKYELLCSNIPSQKKMSFWKSLKFVCLNLTDIFDISMFEKYHCQVCNLLADWRKPIDLRINLKRSQQKFPKPSDIFPKELISPEPIIKMQEILAYNETK